MFLSVTKRRKTGGYHYHTQWWWWWCFFFFFFASFAFSESHEFSIIMLERLEPGFAQEYMQYEGNRFVLVATNE